MLRREPCGISNCEMCNAVGSAQTDLGYIVDSRRTMLLYAFVSKEKLSSSTSPHGWHARVTGHSFTAPSQLFSIEFVPKANQRHCISVSWKINTVISRTHYSTEKKKVINVWEGRSKFCRDSVNVFFFHSGQLTACG